MTLKDFFEAWGPLLPTLSIAFLTIVEIAPIKINPWSALARFIGSQLNAGVTARLDTMQKCIDETREKLDEHIRTGDERNATLWRNQILRFNDELIDGKKHTKEHFDEVLATIDDYEIYCRDHPLYKNNRCRRAIANISRSYDERLEKHDFSVKGSTTDEHCDL